MRTSFGSAGIISVLVITSALALQASADTPSLQPQPTTVLSVPVVPITSRPAGEAGHLFIQLPDFHRVHFDLPWARVSGLDLMYAGLVICGLGLLFSLMQYRQVKSEPVHPAMASVSQTIWETCKTYLLQQGKFLALLWAVVSVCAVYYLVGLRGGEGLGPMPVVVVLLCSALGILGSYGVAWFGIRINTRANSRAAFAALGKRPIGALTIPMKSGMSIGLLLVSVELFFMICILVFLPRDLAGASFVGFAIGESLGASALRICGGIFTKIADIGSDMMKIIFRLPEDDPKNPGVIADCTGDNAGDSIGPTADGFETYGVTGVALITFLALSLGSEPFKSGQLIIWIFAMRVLMILTSLAAFVINERFTLAHYGRLKRFNAESPLTHLILLTSALSIGVTFVATWLLLPSKQYGGLWWGLASIISCGTAAGALIPEVTKVFTSTNSVHVKEVLKATKQGGASLNILSGLVAGNYSAFWEGLVITGLMVVSYIVSCQPDMAGLMPPRYTFAMPIFAFGLVAFGFLGMGPVTIAVDSFGPVTDNAQSVYELSQIEHLPGIADQVRRDYGFDPDFEHGKRLLEANDGAGNTFKATAKPVLIGTAVVGATTMVSGIILLLDQIVGHVVENLSLVQPNIAFGLLMGGATVYWFTGASMQAVVTGACRAVSYIREHLDLTSRQARVEDSKEVVRICARYAQAGMINIFFVIFFMALGLAFLNEFFFIGYLISIAFFGLFQAIFMANAGAAWDNTKKIVEVDLRQAGTDLHAATVVGDTVGDPFKDTCSVAINPVVKFTTLFGLLAAEIAVTMQHSTLKWILGASFLLGALFFICRSFYGMRLPKGES